MADAEMSVSEALAKRRSSRSFLQTPLARKHLDRVLTAGQWAASGGNAQPWRFVVVQHRDALERLHRALVPGNLEWAKSAPAILVVCARPEDSRFHDKEGKQYYLYECGLAVQNMIIQATALGLAARQMGGWAEEKVREALGIPDDYKVVILVAMGHEGSKDSLTEAARAREMKPRVRRKLSEFVMFDAWRI